MLLAEPSDVGEWRNGSEADLGWQGDDHRQRGGREQVHCGKKCPTISFYIPETGPLIYLKEQLSVNQSVSLLLELTDGSLKIWYNKN